MFWYRVINRLPVSQRVKLAWQRLLIDRSYARDIKQARTAKDSERIEVLETGHAHELGMIEEEEDQLYTRQLMRQARRLRVPYPKMYGSDAKPTADWEEGHYLGGWHLTEAGVGKIREEIRKELRWRFERRAHWVLWLSATTGVIGALTGLVAVLFTR